MNIAPPFELPPHLKPLLQKGQRLEWITLAYIASVVVVMYLVIGSSQAMKSAWIEDGLGLLSPIAFLIASHVYDKRSDARFPYGHHRAFGIAFLAGSLTLFSMGCFLIVDSSLALIKAEHPSIGSVTIFGHQVWMGWLMIVALLYSGIPSMILGYRKLPIARKLHNKILMTDADTQKADYMTAAAAIVGIIGVGFGLWWADATAALFIAVSVVNDGFSSLRRAIDDLIDKHPTYVDSDKTDRLIEEIRSFVRSWDWVDDASVRLREAGQVYFGEVYVTPRADTTHLVDKVEEGIERLRTYHWKLHDVVLVPVQKVPEW